MSEIPFTERPNPITANIDVAEPAGILDLLRQCDEELWTVWNERHAEVGAFSARVQELDDPLLVIAGCGTSGRVGILCCKLLLRRRCGSLLAGGASALVESNELPEDDPYVAVKELQALRERHAGRPLVVMGISCGISAPYVLGLLHWALRQSSESIPLCALMGFNPVSLARDAAVENWPQMTCRKVAQQMWDERGGGRCFVINPVLGGEPITGSSRMKGGSAGFALAMCAFGGYQLDAFESAGRQLYDPSHASGIAKCIELAAASLKNPQGHIYYVGAGPLGLMGIIDASEMFDTYGEKSGTVRGFVSDKYPELEGTESYLKKFANLERRMLIFGTEGRSKSGEAEIRLPGVKDLALQTFVVKLLLNAISTGACVLKGHVLRNSMINAGPLNDKIFHRCVEMVGQYGGSQADPFDALIASIHKKDVTDVSEALLKLPISEHCKLVPARDRVLPTAILMTLGYTFDGAIELLNGNPAIRSLIAETVRYVGIDGGGTKTAVAVLDGAGTLLREFSVDQGSNHNSIGLEKTTETLEQVFRGLSNVRRVFMGMAGVDRPEDRLLYQGIVRSLAPGADLVVESDAICALASGTGGVARGIVLISGTGTICYGFDGDGSSTRAGGWGPAMGDRGSGYDVALQILTAVARSADGISPPTLLTEAVLQLLGLETAQQLVPWCYKDTSWSRFAALAPLAAIAARKGDAAAIKIVEDAVAGLWASIEAVSGKLSSPAETYVLSGGMLTHENSIYAQKLTAMIEKHFPTAHVTHPSMSPAHAAAMLAYKRDAI